MESYTSDVTIVGAGVVGLAVARAVAQAGREVLVVEAARSFGQGISSRNSEVVHSGLYYAKDSLKATLCVEGRRRLYDFCQARGIAHRVCGKLVVAPERSDVPRLDDLRRRGVANGVDGITMLGAAAVARLEPALRAEAALHVACTGILDSHAFMAALRDDIQAAGGSLAYETPVRGGDLDGGLTLHTGGRDPARLTSRTLVICAGGATPGLLDGLGFYPAAARPVTYAAKGSYFSCAGRPPFSRLIYPLPEPGGLGVHATLDLAGQIRFGPDTEWTDDPVGTKVDPGRAPAFYAAIRRYWPALPDGALEPAYAGTRPKMSGPGQPDADFLIQGPATHGIEGLVVLLGIESPGLTASLALADLVARRLAPDAD